MSLSAVEMFFRGVAGVVRRGGARRHTVGHVDVRLARQPPHMGPRALYLLWHRSVKGGVTLWVQVRNCHADLLKG